MKRKVEDMASANTGNVYVRDRDDDEEKEVEKKQTGEEESELIWEIDECWKKKKRN